MTERKTLLIVDDEPNVRKAVIRMMRECLPGVEVLETETCEQAFKVITSVFPDVVLLDVLMPGLNGLALLKQLKNHADKEIRNIPVFVISGVANKEVSITAKKMGALDYITKPIAEKVLTLKLKKYLK